MKIWGWAFTELPDFIELIHSLIYSLPSCKQDNLGLLWWSSGWDSVFSLLWPWVQLLVGKLRSHKLHSEAKKQKQRKTATTKKQILRWLRNLWKEVARQNIFHIRKTKHREYKGRKVKWSQISTSTCHEVLCTLANKSKKFWF